MLGWHHQLDGHKSEQIPLVSDGQGSLVCCSPWGCKELDMTEQLNNKSFPKIYAFMAKLYLFISNSCVFIFLQEHMCAIISKIVWSPGRTSPPCHCFIY